MAFRQDSSQSQVTSRSGLFPYKLEWKKGPSAVIKMSAPNDAAVHGAIAYFRPYRSREIYSFNCQSQEWRRLPDCCVKDTSLVILPVAADNCALCTIGGIKRTSDWIHEADIYTDALFQLRLDQNAWIPSDTYSNMPTKRSQVTAVYTDQMLIAAGGRNSTGVTAVVEVLNVINYVWYRIADLPRTVYRASGCVCQQKLFILGGYDIAINGPILLNIAYEIDLHSLTLACTTQASPNIYKIVPVPLCNSTFVSVYGFILAIGGSEWEDKRLVSSSKVHSYHPLTQSWHLLSSSSLLEKRSFPFSVTFNKGKSIDIVVIGGYTMEPDVDCTDSMELSTLPEDLKLFPFKLEWKKGQSALKKMSAPIDAAVHGTIAYFRPYRSREIYSFNCQNQEWSHLSDCACRVKDTSLVMLPRAVDRCAEFVLCTIGGIKREIDRKHKDDSYTNALFQLQLDQKVWISSDTYPNMPTERSQVTAVYTDQMLIAAGGRNSTGVTAIVEVFHSINCVWYRIADLPRTVYRASGCVCQQKLFILGGCDMGETGQTPLNIAYEIDLHNLTLACTGQAPPDIYKKIMPVPFYHSTFVSVYGFILAIGGSEWNDKRLVSSSKVHSYHPLTHSWHLLSSSSLLEKRSFPFSVTFNKGKSIDIVVVGGYTMEPDVDCTDSMELSTLTEDIGTVKRQWDEPSDGNNPPKKRGRFNSRENEDTDSGAVPEAGTSSTAADEDTLFVKTM